MFQRGIAIGCCLAVLSGFLSCPAAWAKPADLPSHQPIECAQDGPPARQFSIEIDITSRGIGFKFDAASPPAESLPVIDGLLPAFVEHWLQHAADALVRPDRMNLEHLLRRLPQVLVPTNILSRMAMERLQENLRDASEEQAFPATNVDNRDVRNGSILLGLVEIVH